MIGLTAPKLKLCHSLSLDGAGEEEAEQEPDTARIAVR